MELSRGLGTKLQGRLFTDYFLLGGIRVTSEWLLSVAAPDEFVAFRDGVRERYESVSGYSEPNEAVTERDLILACAGAAGVG